MIALQAADAAPPGWLSGWVGLLVGIVGLLGILASAAAYVRAGYAKATVATLAESNAALSGRVESLKEEAEAAALERAQEKAREAADRATLEGRVEALERENSVLREVIQGKADLERLASLLDSHHDHVCGELGKVQGTLEDVLAASGEVANSQKAVRSMVGRVYTATVGANT